MENSAVKHRKSIWYQNNSGNANMAYAKEVCDVAILPIGAIEQHGPHCPTGSDSFNAIGIAERVAEKTGATLLPCPMYGSHPYMHWGMSGTIPLRYETHIALLKDIVRGAATGGYNKFIIISAHGQVAATLVAVNGLGLEGYFTLSSTWYDFLRDDKTILKDYMWHADEAETSVALHLYPDLVDMSLAVPGGGEALVDASWRLAPGQGSAPGTMYHFEGTFASLEKDELDTGVIGNPENASKEKGKLLVDEVVGHYCELIEEIKEKYPCGINPLGFRNPHGYAGFPNNIHYDDDHDEKGNLLK